MSGCSGGALAARGKGLALVAKGAPASTPPLVRTVTRRLYPWLFVENKDVSVERIEMEEVLQVSEEVLQN